MEEDLTFELWLIKNNYERDLRSKEAQNAATPGNGNEEKKDSQVIRKVERNLKEEKTCSEHMVCGKDVEIDADNCNLGQHGRKRKEKDFTEELNGINKEGDQKKSNSSLISLDLASAKESDLLLPESTKVEECSGTKQVECKREMNAGVDLGISADGDTNGHCVSDDGIKVDGSSGERTRKKMRIEEEGAGDGDGDADNNGREEKVSIFVSRSSDSIKDSSVSSKKEVAEERIKSEDPKDVKEERKGFDASDDPDVGANVNCEHNDNADEKMGHKKGKGKRGRKRKKVETEKSNEDSSYEREKVNEVPLDYNTPNTGRVLRSRTMPMSSGGKAVDIVSQKKRNATGIALGTQSSGKRGRKKLERRGRPRKYITDSKEEAEFPEGKKKKDAIGIGLSTQSSGRRGRKKQERRGRPRKQTTDSNEEAVFPVAKKKTRASKVMGDEEQKVIEGSMSVIDCGNDRLDSDSHQDGESINGKQLKTSHHNKEGNMGRREEKQLVREKIISLITKAGWNIQYRPRQGTERFDAVYCDREGRTYWSITLAYKMLKMKAESGEADDQTVSAFSPIPEEELEKLYKKMNKKRRDKGEPRSAKAIKGIKVAKNKIIKTGGSRMKEEIKSKRLRDKSSKKKRKHLHAERKESVRRSGRRVLKPFQERRRGGKPCALLARIADKVSDSDSCLTYDGKRSLLSWMIDLGTIPHKVDVQYKEGRKRRVMLDGRITRDGIHCGCCDEILTVLDFEVHSGSKMCQAFKNIYLLSGKSLLQCLRDSWSRQEESDHIGFRFVDVNGDDPNDDTCNLCGDGGDLICCDSCPSTFHQSCLDIQEFPTDDWNCVYCSCKFCATVAGKASTRNDDHDNVVDELLTCHMCNEKFHQLCLQESGAIQADSSGQSFCGRKCKKLFEQLQVLVGVKHELEEGFSWSLLRRSDICEDKLSDAQIECNSKLAVAFSIMDECFVPIIDERSGINMIHNVVFNCGSNFSRLNYSGFFTVILERGDEIFCAASIRMHGNQLAEMPFIGTRYIYRRQGMCRRLLTAIESALASLDVDNLVIPAIPELLQTWTSVFGFSPLEKSKRKEMRCMNMIVFPGIDILEKPLLKSHSPRETNAPFDSTSHLLDGSINEASSLTSDAKEEATVDDTRNEEAKICNHKPDSPDESSPAAFDGGCEARISCMDNEPEPSCRVEVSHEACCEVKLKEECVGGESESCSPDGDSVPGTQLCSEISEQPGSPVCLTAGSVCAAKSSAAQASVLT